MSDETIVSDSLTQPWGQRHSQYVVLAAARRYTDAADSVAPWFVAARADHARFTAELTRTDAAVAAEFEGPRHRLAAAPALARAQAQRTKLTAALAQITTDVAQVLAGDPDA